VQGITEFLPVSSTAHIIITSMLLDLQFEGLTFEIFLHLASVLAVIIYFHKDIKAIITGSICYILRKNEADRVHYRFGLYIIIATIITGVLGVILSDWLSDAIKTPPFIALSLVVTGLFLIFIERVHKIGQKDEHSMGIKETLIVAAGQTLSVFPGISRSGSTLVAALLSGLNREAAVRFSFLLAIPVILGSTVLMLRDYETGLIAEAGALSLVVAFIASFLFSIIGIMWLIDFLRKSKLIYFAIYCFILATFVYFFLDPTMLFEVSE